MKRLRMIETDRGRNASSLAADEDRATVRVARGREA